jgi:hypothetical protein
MYILDLSGHDEKRGARRRHFGGRFLSIDDAEAHGRLAACTGRFAFTPSRLWVHDEEFQVVRQVELSEQ